MNEQNKHPGVSIIMPLWKPDNIVLKKVIDSVNKQHYNGPIEIIQVNEGWGLAKTLNHGTKIAKYPIIVSLHQDCIPISENWLETLIKPLEKNNVVACTSDVKDFESGKTYTPLLDEKGCAYKKDILEKIGYWNEEVFLNSGEDVDLYIRLKKIGEIAYPHSIIEHYHPGYLGAVGYKKLQNANTNGTLFRIYGLSFPGWWKSLIMANVFNWGYCYWYWRGFFKRKQDFKR